MEAATVKANDNLVAYYSHGCRLSPGGGLQVGKGLSVLSDIQGCKDNAMCGKQLFHVVRRASQG